MFHELAEESKIIFWKRFEQFLDFAKINHLQKIKKKFSKAVGKI